MGAASSSRAALLMASATATPCAALAGFVHARLQEPDFFAVGPGGAQLQDIAAQEFLEADEAWRLQNLLGAIHLFGRSAQKGHEVGEYCYRWGQYHELPPADVHQALRWYKRGARMNHPASTTMLGKLHLALGHQTKAREWLSLTAAPNRIGGEHGDSLAQWFLAELHLQGGALRDAVRWWKRSAENGDVDAMMRLSEVFSAGGAGIPQEDMRARHWLFAAAAHGHQGALSRVDLDWPGDGVGRPPVEQRWIEHMQRRGWA